MGQLTIRADDGLLHRVRAAAAARGSSMNEYVTGVLDAATNPDLAGDEAQRVRERLAAAGLLDVPSHPATARPSPARAAAARRAAGAGTTLAELVSTDRG
jgi:plasmid stability protein